MSARRALPTRPARFPWPALLGAVVLLLVVWAAVRALTAPRNPAPQTAALSRTSAQDWAELRAFGPREIGTPGHDRAVAWLRAQLTALGYPVRAYALTFPKGFDAGGELRVGTRTVPVRALPGSRGGEQEGRLVRLPPDAPSFEYEKLGLPGNLAITTCPRGGAADLVERVLGAQGLGLVLVDDCPTRAYQPVSDTPLPLVRVDAAAGRPLLALAGQSATLRSAVTEREVTATTLVAARVGARPEILIGAHLDSVPASPGANDNASGVLAALEVARQATRTGLAGRAWFAFFDAEEDGLLGSSDFADRERYTLRQTRAMLNLDMVGVAAQPLGVAADPGLVPLARGVRPGIRLFEEARTGPETFGRSSPYAGRSDHRPFKAQGVRTAFIHRGLDANYHAPSDQTLDLALVNHAATFALNLADAALKAPWTPDESCGITGRDCRY